VVANSSTPLTNSHNAYINCSGRFTPTNINDVVLTNFTYATGPLGEYYHLSTNLTDAGSVTNAVLAGLYHYTTLTNQTKEAGSRLDIGLHLPAMDSSGEAADTDHGGVPDYLEDANGNGAVNTNETDWSGNAADDDLAGVYGSILVPRYLRCEYRQNPLGVETNYGPPRFYWIVTSNRRAQKQSAYRVLVASSEANLNNNNGDVWNSGIVPTDQTLHLEYKGNALASGQRLWWKVRSWDAWGSRSPWSTNAFFQMGLLSTNDWTAQWLTTATDPGDNVSPMYRRAFVQLTNDIKRATAYVSAKGVYDLWLDGQRIGPNILAPEWTDYNLRFQYQTYDVTTNLLSGNTDGTNHVIGAIVGEGWFHGSINHDAARAYYYTNYASGHGPKQLLLQLRIDRNDGSSNIITTDINWTCNPNGPIRYASIEHGETFDATKLASISNWSTFKYTGEGAVFTAPVATESLITTQMFAQPTDPIQIIGYVQPIDMWTNRNGGITTNRFVRIFDMGRVIEGWCILSLTNTIEPTGTNIYLRHAGALQLDSNNRQVRGANISDFSLCGYWGLPEKKAAQKETYVILQTNIVQQFQPHFTYHSFRFIEVDAPERIPLDVN
jgi:alpha-L-rhamnosidase